MVEVARKIIHCDADCFFAAIEMRDDPSLRGRALAVGGSSGRRGVIAACNYQARVFGVHSAMASSVAERLCPDLLIVPPRMDAYRQAAEDIRHIFYQYTDLVEPLSLDEAYLDVSGSEHCSGSATLMATEIRQKIVEKVGITVSAGVAPNKFLAKIASDWKKPNGLFVITPQQVESFVYPLAVRKIHGVGKVTTQKLKRLDVESCADLRRFTIFQLTEYFGSFGPRLYDLSRGLDKREVKPARRRKSLSVEHTYEQDLPSSESCLQALPALMTTLARRLGDVGADYRVVKAFVKVKFADFSITTLERVGTAAVIDDYRLLLREAIARHDKPVRLLGIGVRFEDPVNMQQMDFFSLDLIDNSRSQ